MAKPLVQRVQFNATPETLYAIYMDPRKHAKAIGSEVRLVPKEGGRFSAFGMLEGRFLLLEKGKRIVQTWRGTHWKKHDPDSILILTFKKSPGGAELMLVHTQVPEHDYKGVQEGWPMYYWRPWKEYLANALG